MKISICPSNDAASKKYTISIESVNKGNSFIFLARFENEVVASIWPACGGKMFTYIMGGFDKPKKNLNLGYLLQWAAICKSIELGFETYNISTGGSLGVVSFKKSFNPKEISSSDSYLRVITSMKY